MDIPEGIPQFFVDLLNQQYAEMDVQRILDGCADKRATTLRANALRSDRDAIARALDEAGIGWQGVPWYGDAFVTDGNRLRDVRELAIYEEGSIYVQSLSSMLPPLALAAQPGEDVLDACAAPGGKTTQIAALTQGKAHITACEMHAPRAERLEHNLRKLGAANVTVMRADARRLDDFFAFDRILVDAPCSGSGTIDIRDARMRAHFTPTLVQKSRKAQSALLDKALRLLKPGGTLVYSTCSVLACENEEAVNGALERARRHGGYDVRPIALAGAEDIPQLPTVLDGTLAVCPTPIYEGFFMAKIVRTR